MSRIALVKRVLIGLAISVVTIFVIRWSVEDYERGMAQLHEKMRISIFGRVPGVSEVDIGECHTFNRGWICEATLHKGPESKPEVIFWFLGKKPGPVN